MWIFIFFGLLLFVGAQVALVEKMRKKIEAQFEKPITSPEWVLFWSLTVILSIVLGFAAFWTLVFISFIFYPPSY